MWMVLLIGFLIGLSVWAIFFIDTTEHRITIFGIVGAIIVAITSVLSVTLNNKSIKERELELLVIREKQKVFEHFYNAYFEMLKAVKKGKTSNISNKAENEMLEFKRGLMNWGSEALIQNYLDFDSKLVNSKSETSTFDMLRDGDKFLKDLRKEMGFNDSDKINIMSIILDAESRESLKK
jgi:uncharacterized membrane protein